MKVLLGLCENSLLDWNYYLEQKDGKIFYEGYSNTNIERNEDIWKTHCRINNQTFMSMNTTENKIQYPVGVFKGFHLDPNG